ncbi:acetoacetate--CoA ligase [Solimonas marina]|uniref:Acetoacetate--CoA ligase n=1 Tax=Solimonas marina TaxID=2714601 RepID=A0A969W8C0_9GAMM|nr:acetoacetate--CoA ligase [Solimonas marina]NKF21853.1 acetoacetate--CoA ligase [Solimonas marina]
MPHTGPALWQPSAERRRDSNLTHYLAWLKAHGHRFDDYGTLHRWSVQDPEAFWASIWQYFGVKSRTPYRQVLESRQMPGARWFGGARVNFAEHLLRAGSGSRPALWAASETQPLRSWSWDRLHAEVRAAATALRRLGVEPGDRVCSCLPNIPEAAIALLASASIGAIWSSCSPDFGAATITDRFSQITPKVLLTSDGYHYGGQAHDRRDSVAELLRRVPSIEHVVHVPGLSATLPDWPVTSLLSWPAWLAASDGSTDFVFADTAFDDPLWVVYSSGTTGLPKPFVHGHGGILIEYLKFHHLHFDLKPSSTLFYFTTTGWVMWNMLIAGLLTGSAVVLYDGHPMSPRPDVLWKLAQDTGTTFFGASPSYIGQLQKMGLTPAQDYDLSRLRSMMLGGAPVMPEHMQWCYTHINADLWLTSQSGGTDVASGFVGGVPTQPVYPGEIQARCLGVDVESYDDAGQPCLDAVGELVVRQPMPSMPLRFWNDDDAERYRQSYFTTWPGVWRHGDYLRINARGGCQILGRSDSTLNRHGVRIGTAEIYRTLESVAEIRDSLIVNLDLPGGGFFMPLFVVLRDDVTLDSALQAHIAGLLRTQGSPRHVPDAIVAAPAVPYTLTGKKMEVPVRKLLLGAEPDSVASRDAMANPQALDWYVGYAQRRATDPTRSS